MLVADMHCDTISALWKLKQERKEGNLAESPLHLDLAKMRKGKYLLQNFALFVNQAEVKDPSLRAFEYLALYEEELEKYKEYIAPVYRYQDIHTNKSAGKISALLTLEEGGILKGSSRLLKEYYEHGVRMITLTWNFPNELGYPCKDTLFSTGNMEKGLTKRGKELVEEMEEIGIIPDVSHLSDRGFYDVIELTKKPFVASHSNARALCPAARNLTDEMIRLLGEKGGVMGLNYYPRFLSSSKEGAVAEGRIQEIVAHAQHIVKVGGIDTLGLGSDFDGIPLHKELPDASYMPLLWDAMKKAGFTPLECDKIFSGNVLRLYQETFR